MINQIISDMICICLKATLIKTPGLKQRDGDMLENENVKVITFWYLKSCRCFSYFSKKKCNYKNMLLVIWEVCLRYKYAVNNNKKSCNNNC